MLVSRAATGILFFVAITISFFAPCNAKQNPATKSAADKSVVTIPLFRARDRVFVKAAIDGIEIGYLTVDTGSNVTVIHSDIAKQRNLKVLGGRWLNTQEGRALHPLALAHSLKVGLLELKDQPVYIDPNPSGTNPANEVIAGALGMDVLGKQPLEIDFYKPSLSLFDTTKVAGPFKAYRAKLQPNRDTPRLCLKTLKTCKMP